MFIFLKRKYSDFYTLNVLTVSAFMIRDKDQKNMDKWRIIVDERLRKIDSFPHFFHGDYCVPQVGGVLKQF